MNISYLIGPISGGIIGYFTNWLAIKMLFRPHLPFDDQVGELQKGHDEQLIQHRQILLDGYRQVISVHLPKILSTIDISRIIRKRINEMDVKESERIILSVMNKELRAIVWLGALLGCVIGAFCSLF
jgi:uncharacterized membrane protein YheB (UPF0754 family)